ncbi:hypothetical protein GS429_15825 [Natronorubrum sp. JWXQ-INN-674]|uniref:Uncharacterized protein n=1 Tax=Natronorubrum halalkaliphilum TaxID=2691917 RepID=A0A6B0VR10_9EURY|nr:hypothetical protein [Natronorubrum halalkaliphilum]MXV63497.1 hypothetical protein [Natronorubrum halalkaliphilum]
MSEWTGIQFETNTPEDAQRVIDNYAIDAVERVSSLDACEAFTFAPAWNPETEDRSKAAIAFKGDSDAIIQHERDRWNSLVEEGVATNWNEMMSMDEAEMVGVMGEKGAELWPRLGGISAKMAKLAYEEFDDLETLPGAVETYPEEDREIGPLGWWSVLHTVTVQLNYSLDEEIDAYLYGIEHTLRNHAEYQGEDVVNERIDELIDALDGMREEVVEGRLR